jgi:prolyl oligopeptidase
MGRAHRTRSLAALAAFVAFAAAAGCRRPGGSATLSAPGMTRQGSDSTTFFGVTVPDPYRWLEDGGSPEVKQWIEAQNARTEAVLASFPEGAAISARVEQLATTSAARSAPEIRGHTLFYLRETPPAPQPVLVAEDWPSGNARTLVDVNASGGDVAIAAYWPSPTGRYVAYGTAEGGSELTTIRFRDTASGETLPDALPYAGGGTSPQALAWDADERGVTYARYPLPEGNAPVTLFNTTLCHHALGAQGTDPVVFGAGYSRIAEYRLLTSADGRHVAALVETGDGGFAEVYLRASSEWRLALGLDAGVTAAAYVGDRLFVVATGGSPRGRVVAIAPDGKASDIVTEGDWAIQSLAPVGGGFLAVRTSGPDWRVDQYTGAGAFVRTAALPAGGIQVEEIASDSASNDALIAYSGWTQPTRWARYEGNTGRLTTIFEVQPAADYSHVQVNRIEGTSKDGTKIPVTILGLEANGQAKTPRPTILYSYGGFDIPIAPTFLGSNLAWLERGGLFAYANIRGGNEFGEAWHQAGKDVHKQNVFDDFHAAAQALVAQGWTTPDRLGAHGRSNGGLLMGAAITQHPDDYRAVVSFVGIYDMLRHQTFPNGAYNVTEYGTTDDPEQFAALKAYSPLQNVRSGANYPAVLLETGLNDPRVASWQSRKFAAALQAASSSDRPILLLTRTNAGHGIGAPFSQRVNNAALMLTFFAHELGAGSQ